MSENFSVSTVASVSSEMGAMVVGHCAINGISGPVHMSPQSIGRKVAMNTTSCQGITKSGNACKNKVAEGNTFCHLHVVPVVAPEATEFPRIINQGGKMNIIHFLRETNELDGFNVRVVTNMPSEAEQAAFELSSLHHGIENIGNTSHRLLAVNIGSQTMPLFERANRLGVKFRFMTVPIKSLKDNPEIIGKWLSRSNFAWANDQNASFIKFDGVSEWGLEPLGLKVSFDKKLAKRLNEVARVTSHFFEGPITMREFKSPTDSESDKRAYDGMNFIRQSFAKKLGFEEDRGNIRSLTEVGEIKGDMCVVPDALLDVDLVYHTENLKPALATIGGWTLTTCMAHAPLHELRHDDQTRANFSYFITPQRVMDDLNVMVRAFKDSVHEGGDLAEFLASQSQSFDDPIAVDYERFGTSQRIEETAEMLKEIGIAPASFSNIPYTRLGAIVRKMEASRIEGTKFFKRMPIPAGNAFLGAIVTYESCVDVGNVEFPHQDGTMTFFDSRYGIIMPADRFDKTYHLHGGWDLDDTVGLFLVKVYCTNRERLVQMVESGLLDENIEVPSEESQAIEVGLMVRRPNGPGEYSIEKIDASAMPWMHYDADKVIVVDLTDAPYDQTSVFAKATITGVNDSQNFNVDYTRGAASEAIHAQMENPGVGGFANVLMAWTATFGVGEIPETLIGCMEDVVDACQQTADPVSFAHIRDEVRRLWIAYAEKVIETSTIVDYGVWISRVPSMVAGKVPVGEAIKKAGLLQAGWWTRINHRFNDGIEFCRKLAMDTANSVRLSLPLAVNLQAMEFDATYEGAVIDMLRASNRMFKDLDNSFRAQERMIDGNAIMRRAIQVQRRVATEAMMDRIVDSILAKKSHDPHLFVLAMYKHITTPKQGWPNGEVDRIFVQPSTAGHTSLMQLFVEAVEVYGALLSERI